MANRITWTPSADPAVVNAGHYDLQSAPDDAGSPGTFIDLTEVNDLRPGPAYSGGIFFFDDAGGVSTTWYRIRTTTGTGEVSVWGDPFQNGAAAAPPSLWTTEALIESIKRRGSIPVSQVTFSDSDLLELADEEIATTLVPLIMAANEDYLTAMTDLSFAPHRIPSRAVGAKLFSVTAVDSEGEETPLPKVRPEMNPSFGFYLTSGFIVPVNRTGSSYPTLRLRYALRPAKLVPTGEVGLISLITWGGTPGSSPINFLTLSLMPTGFASGQLFDVVKGTPPFDTVVLDAQATVEPGRLTFASPPSVPVEWGVEAGDLVCPAGRANVVQLPAEWFPVLAQLVAAKCLSILGDPDAKDASAKADKMMGTALDLITPRTDGNPEVIVPRWSPWRR